MHTHTHTCITIYTYTHTIYTGPHIHTTAITFLCKCINFIHLHIARMHATAFSICIHQVFEKILVLMYYSPFNTLTTYTMYLWPMNFYVTILTSISPSPNCFLLFLAHRLRARQITRTRFPPASDPTTMSVFAAVLRPSPLLLVPGGVH